MSKIGLVKSSLGMPNRILNSSHRLVNRSVKIAFLSFTERKDQEELVQIVSEVFENCVIYLIQPITLSDLGSQPILLTRNKHLYL